MDDAGVVLGEHRGNPVPFGGEFEKGEEVVFFVDSALVGFVVDVDGGNFVFVWVGAYSEIFECKGFVVVELQLGIGLHGVAVKHYIANVYILGREGDIVAVEANPGHDSGVVSLTGRLAAIQMKKANLKSADDIRRVYRLARPVDMEKYQEAKSREHATMIESRQIAKGLGLQMKIGDVEYQGDCNKAIFYYIADERVDFRQLIKDLAATFHVRIEMKQIGARQEAGLIGGTGPCGRELCCATWMKNFVSVGTQSARYQDISLNPQKLAGMCAKLKCCLNYEVDDYVEASRQLPPKDIQLQTQDSDYYYFKADILAGLITYSTDKNIAANLETITAERAKQIIEMNRRGEKPDSLTEDGGQKAAQGPVDLATQENIARFDRSKKKKKKKNRKPQAPRNDQ